MDKSYSMRLLIDIAAGPRGWNDNRKSWLNKAATLTGIPYRTIRALWYGEITDSGKSADRLRHAIEFLTIAGRLERLDPLNNQSTVGALRSLAQQLGNLEGGARPPQGHAKMVRQGEDD